MHNSNNFLLTIVLMLPTLLFNQRAGAAPFDIAVPIRTPPIQRAELFVDLPNTVSGNVFFDITRHSNVSEMQTIMMDTTLPINDPNATQDATFTMDDEQAGIKDDVTLSLTNGFGLGKRLKMFLRFKSNWLASDCSTAQLSNEVWTIEPYTLSGTSHIPIAVTGACVNSYETGSTPPDCGGGPIIAPNATPATIVATPPIPTIIPCGDVRPPIDVMLVLDKSGSMISSDKIGALNSAVHNFVDLWSEPGIAILQDPDPTKPYDILGTVLFNQDASDWVADPGLQPFSSTLVSTIKTTPITAGGSTSIGDGLAIAAAHFNSTEDPLIASKRKVILLMSDGMQNTNRMVAVVPDDGSIDGPGGLTGDLDNDGDQTDMVAVTHLRNGTDYQPLPNLPNLNIWSVTFGTAATDIDPTIFTELASTGTGFYINSEADPNDLKLFFLELLQNFLRFNTIETTRLVSDSIPIVHLSTGDIGTTQLKVATTSTAKTVSFSVMWDETKDAEFGMQIVPPAGPPFTSGDEGSNIKRGPGYMRFTTSLPLPDPYPKGSQIGEWTVKITVNGSGLGKKFPYQFYALADDDSVKAKFDIKNGDYVTGKPIPLQAKLTEFGQALVNRDGKLNVFAKLIKPEDGIGNLLSENTATGTGTGTGTGTNADTKSPAQQKLDAMLEKDPNLLKYSSEIIQLYDDGLSSHNDKVANDGIFNNLYTNTNKQGQYNFLFSVEGKTNQSGPMSRQQIETVYVRLQPDLGNTEITSQFIGNGPDRQLKVSMTPRDRFGNHFGPGYANYFLVSPLNGKRPKFQDSNLNGTYEFTIPANADGSLPKLDVKYVKPFMHVSDEMYPDKIPQSLTESYVIDGLRGKKHSVSLHLGVNYPHGKFDKDFDGKTSYALDYEYRWDKSNSLLVFLGKNTFDHPTIDLDITNLSINAKHYFIPPAIHQISYFVNGGLGYYSADPGDDDLGLNLGGGAQYQINNDFGVEGWYNYHHITSDPEVKFSTLQLGVYYLF